MRPVIQAIGLTHYDVHNGWQLVPLANITLKVVAKGADAVTFHAITPGQVPAPETDGIVAHAEPIAGGAPGETIFQVTIPNSLGGSRRAIYAVADNQHGQAVSEVINVAWHNGKGFTTKDRKEP